jgi:hypothetical protein
VSDIPRNIILVGTKVDLCRDGPKNKRQVQFQEAVDLAKRLNFAGCFEISNKYNNRAGQQDGFFQRLNDVFGLSSCLCVDQTTREIAQELSMMP